MSGGSAIILHHPLSAERYLQLCLYSLFRFVVLYRRTLEVVGGINYVQTLEFFSHACIEDLHTELALVLGNVPPIIKSVTFSLSEFIQQE